MDFSLASIVDYGLAVLFILGLFYAVFFWMAYSEVDEYKVFGGKIDDHPFYKEQPELVSKHHADMRKLAALQAFQNLWKFLKSMSKFFIPFFIMVYLLRLFELI